MSPQPTRRWDRQTTLLAWLAACASVVSFIFYFRRGDILLYGDAVAHINIARRVFDSRTPGLLQLGTVWLPLPHLLMIPFLLSNWMWRSGIGGSIPSMAAYVFGTLGIFRLVRSALTGTGESDAMARATAWAAATVYAANPNLIYLQATAMTEPLYLALFIWAVVYFNEFVQEAGSLDESGQSGIASSSLVKCGICLAAACLTRYDAWFLSAVICVAGILVVALNPEHRGQPRTGLKAFLLLAAAAPLLWLSYNATVYRNPLEFANGPYSAKAIEQRTPGASHPGSHNLQVAVSYSLKSAELNLATEKWQKPWILLAVAGVLTSLIAGFARNSRSLLNQSPGGRQWWPLLLLWTPLPFYALSVAYGGVPIFMPVWWPFSYYNVRYGLQLLPAFAIFASLAFYSMARLAQSRAVTVALAGMALILVSVSYISIGRDPVCFREAWINSRTRVALERELADFVKALPPDSTLLMYLGDHVGALQEVGFPLRRVIYEGTHRTWKQPADAEGLWERALANPAQYANFVIAFEGDSVSKGVQKRDLLPLAVIHVSGQPEATIYQTHAPAR
jgi:hypothetical protein